MIAKDGRFGRVLSDNQIPSAQNQINPPSKARLGIDLCPQLPKNIASCIDF